jgi:hypothetical protein
MAYSKPVLLAGNVATRQPLSNCPPKNACMYSCQCPKM